MVTVTAVKNVRKSTSDINGDSDCCQERKEYNCVAN